MADQVFNKVVYIDWIKRAGITEHEARAHAEAIEQSLRGIATKADFDLVHIQLERAVRDMTIRTASMMAVLLIVLVVIKFFG
jgi:hypothetical protein